MTTTVIPGKESLQRAARENVPNNLARYTPEFRLIVECLHWPLRQPELARIAACAEDVSDWRRVLAIARRHRVVGLVWQALLQARCTVPAETAKALQSHASASARQAMLLSIESMRLAGLLGSHRIDVLFLKGVTLTRLAYGEPTLRHAKDIDVLIPAEQAEATIRVLRKAGYLALFNLETVPSGKRQLWFRFAKSMDWVHPASGTQLELHWRLTDLPLLRNLSRSAQRQPVTLGPGSTVMTLAADPLLAYLCVHGAAHGWMRLKWLADVHALLPQHDRPAIEATYRRLLLLGAGRSAGQALLLCHDLFGLALPDGLLQELESSAILQVLRRSTLRLLARGGETTEVNDLPFGTTSVYLSRILLGQGFRSVLSELRIWAYRPDKVLQSRLPQPLLFLFPIVRVGSWIGEKVLHGGRSAVKE